MKILVALMMFFPLIVIAQMTHTVEVGPGNYYTPSSLTISSGDVVNWVSVGGYHDVNFGLNSITGESFNNPAEVAYLPPQGAGEMGSITFNVPGTYNYDCSVGNHALMGMLSLIHI